MLNQLTPIAYIRLRFGWISVRLVRQGELVGEFEGKAQVALTRASVTASNPEVVGIGDAVEALRGRAPEEFVIRTAFDHPRVIFGNLDNTVLVMKHFVLAAARQQDVSLRGCRVVIHPQRELEGGLSDIEALALIELATRAGGRDVGIYNGAVELTPQDLTKMRLRKPPR